MLSRMDKNVAEPGAEKSGTAPSSDFCLLLRKHGLTQIWRLALNS